MAGSKAKDICGNWIGIRNRCWSVSMKVGVTMMIMMLVGCMVNFFGCGGIWWLIVLLSHFLLRF
jgi:hypothetical protein